MARTEVEEYDEMIENIKKAGESARRIGLRRADRRWHIISEKLLQMEKLMIQVMQTGARFRQ